VGKSAHTEVESQGRVAREQQVGRFVVRNRLAGNVAFDFSFCRLDGGEESGVSSSSGPTSSASR
jgi:hypothetical protein